MGRTCAVDHDDLLGDFRVEVLCEEARARADVEDERVPPLDVLHVGEKVGSARDGGAAMCRAAGERGGAGSERERWRTRRRSTMA